MRCLRKGESFVKERKVIMEESSLAFIRNGDN